VNREEEPVAGWRDGRLAPTTTAVESSCPRATQLHFASRHAIERINFIECVFDLGKSSRIFFRKLFLIPQRPAPGCDQPMAAWPGPGRESGLMLKRC
jgi:hypothetical protein